MKAAKDFNMGFQPATNTSFPAAPFAAAMSYAPPPNPHNDNPAKADLAQIAGVQAVEASIFSLIDPTGTSFAMTALNLAQGFEVGAAVIDSAQTPENTVQMQQATDRTQQASFTPSVETNNFQTRSFGISDRNDFKISFSRPSDTDGTLSRGIDLSGSMNQLASPFKPQTLGR